MSFPEKEKESCLLFLEELTSRDTDFFTYYERKGRVDITFHTRHQDDTTTVTFDIVVGNWFHIALLAIKTYRFDVPSAIEFIYGVLENVEMGYKGKIWAIRSMI